MRNSLRFQITPRFSGLFRYTAIHDWNSVFNCTYACIRKTARGCGFIFDLLRPQL